VDSENVFGSDTTFQRALAFEQSLTLLAAPERKESSTACAFGVSKFTLRRNEPQEIESYYGQADSWEQARKFRDKIEKDPSYAGRKRAEMPDSSGS